MLGAKGSGKSKAAGASSSSSSSGPGKSSEANLVETSDVYVAEDMEVRDLLDRFSMKKVTWGKDMSVDVRNSGFADALDVEELG